MVAPQSRMKAVATNRPSGERTSEMVSFPQGSIVHPDAVKKVSKNVKVVFRIPPSHGITATQLISPTTAAILRFKNPT